VLTDIGWRAHVAVAGVGHARAFTWARCVDATVAVYREALASA
jgi:alpha-1,3-rhamnosyl/mannosyltransferase